MYMCLYLGVWGELASHKRSSTHRPSSQGWASRCLVLIVLVGMVWVCLHVHACLGSLVVEHWSREAVMWVRIPPGAAHFFFEKEGK